MVSEDRKDSMPKINQPTIVCGGGGGANDKEAGSSNGFIPRSKLQFGISNSK